MLRLAHIINPVLVSQSSDLFVAQPITFKTMEQAQCFAKDWDIDVQLCVAYFPEDESIVPASFEKTDPLDRSILDFKSFETNRKLPLIQDILDRLYSHNTQADYLIYTNVDIAVMPHFYVAVKNIIEAGLDGFVINRRTIPKHYSTLAEIPLMYAEVGEAHPGYDCFIFKRDVYPSYKLGTACIGGDYIGKVLIANLIAYATKFQEFKHHHLTFHIGNDRVWKTNQNSVYATHNKTELLKVLTALEAEFGELDRSTMPGSFFQCFEETKTTKLVHQLKKILQQ